MRITAFSRDRSLRSGSWVAVIPLNDTNVVKPSRFVLETNSRHKGPEFQLNGTIRKERRWYLNGNRVGLVLKLHVVIPKTNVARRSMAVKAPDNAVRRHSTPCRCYHPRVKGTEIELFAIDRYT